LDTARTRPTYHFNEKGKCAGTKRLASQLRDPEDASEITDRWIAGAVFSIGPAGDEDSDHRQDSNEVLKFLRASGRGWQTRMDEAL